MEAGNGWAVKGRASGAQDRTIIDHIMLRYRPIAPKPVVDGSAPGSTPVTNKSELVTKPRKKRKYVRVKKSRRCKVGKEEENKDVQVGENIVSLQLQTENVSGFKEFTAGGSSRNLDFTVKQRPSWMNFDKSVNNGVFGAGGLPDQADRSSVMKPARVVETWVMVDGITDTWLDKGRLGSTDMEKMMNLEVDCCPGLISDGFDRVRWVNLAYKKMVDPFKDGELPPEVVVWLVVKEKIPVLWQAFASTVRVVYTWQKEKHSQTMPCDVWKMDFGGFAWRLDAKAALSLGR